MLFDKRFYPAFWTQFFGAFNDNVFKNALIILITFKAYKLGNINPEQMVALCGAIFILPFFLFSSIAGEICDKYPKDEIIKKIKFAEILIMSVGAYGLITESIFVLIVTLFFMGTQSSFFGPIKYSILPQIIEEHELTQGNALFSMGTFISILMGTILGGSLIAVETYGSMATGSVVLILALIGFIFSLKVKVKPVARDEIKINFNLIETTLSTLKIAKENSDVYHGILGISWYWLVGAILLSVFPVYAKDILGGDESIAIFFLGIFSIGVGFGAMFCGKASKKTIDFGLISIGSLGISIFTICVYFVNVEKSVELLSIGSAVKQFDFHLISIFLFFVSFFSGIFIVPLYTLLQRDSEEDKRSRVIAANNIINALFMVLGSLLLILDYSFGFSAKNIFLHIGILNLIVYYLFYKKYSEFFWRLVCEIIAKLFYRFTHRGEENIPENGAVILISNHVSYIDWLFLTATTKRTPRFVMWYVFFKVPILRIFFKGAKAIPIAGIKENPLVMEQAFLEIDQSLKENKCVAYFPEGFITKDGKMLFFRPGLKKIIDKESVLIVPMYLDGMWGSFFSRESGKAFSSIKAFVKEFRRPVHVEIGKPFFFTSTEDAQKRVESLK